MFISKNVFYFSMSVTKTNVLVESNEIKFDIAFHPLKKMIIKPNINKKKKKSWNMSWYFFHLKTFPGRGREALNWSRNHGHRQALYGLRHNRVCEWVNECDREGLIRRVCVGKRQHFAAHYRFSGTSSINCIISFVRSCH